MDKNTFFSDKNTDLIYTICRDEIQKKTQYNIDNNKKYFKTFGEIMKIVHKHAPNKNDLDLLNNRTIGKTIPYLVGEIEKKKIKEQPLIPKTNILNAPPIRQESIASQDAPPNNSLPMSLRGSATSINTTQNLQNDFNRIVEERKDFHDMPENLSMTVEEKTNYEDPNILLNKQLKEREMIDSQHKPNLQQNMEKPSGEVPRIQRTLLETQTAQVVPELNLQSYDLNEEVLSDLYGNTDMNTYKEENTNIDPMKLFEQHMNQRNSEDSDYKQLQQNKIDFEEQQKKDNQIIDAMRKHHDLRKQKEEEEFQKSLSQQLNSKMNNMEIDSIRSQMDRRMEQSLDEVILPPTANDLKGAQENKLDVETTEFFKMKNEIFSKRNYINREHLLIVNSGDRDWVNESEDRYSFQVRFKPSSGDTFEMVPKIDSDGIIVRQTEMGTDEFGRKIYTGDVVYEKKLFKGEQGLGVDNLYKNIVSFEMVRVLMAIENIIIPFDNRFFIDYKSLPYISLKIDEIQPLYDGTNGRINNTFAKLLFDKDHTNTVIVNPKQADGSSDYSRKYSRQLTRGYSSMAPMSNEKKTFYPSPLASLNRLTISMLTPYGANIKNHPDVLTVNTVKFVALNDGSTDLELDLDNSKGFPNDNTADTSTYYLEVETTTAFSNRVFKLGDNVRFRGFNSTVTDDNINKFKDFMNREEGHYIINLQLEETGQNKNEGYITKFFIAPPGEISYGSSATKSDYYTLSKQVTFNSSNVNIGNDKIHITSHGFSTGDEVLYVADNTAIGGLTTNTTYYVIRHNVNDIHLASSLSNALASTEINFIGAGVGSHTLIQQSVNLKNTGTCKVLNQSIQTHFVFKVVTREDDMTSVMKPVNV